MAQRQPDRTALGIGIILASVLTMAGLTVGAPASVSAPIDDTSRT